MALNARLELRQGQGLVITPQLQQAIKLLQLSNIELDAYVDAEMEKNPLLARDEPEAAADHEDSPGSAGEDLAFDSHAGGEASSQLDAAAPDIYDASPGERASGDGCEGSDSGFQTATPGAADAGGAVDWSKAGKGGAFDGDDDGLERALAREPTLHEHLDDQISAAGFTDAERADRRRPDRCGGRGRLPARRPRRGRRAPGLRPGRASRRCWPRCQGFEPTGVFARDVRRMPDAAAEGAGPLRPGHGRAARQSRAAGPARHGRAAPRLRRRRRRPARDDRRAAGADAPARRGLRRRARRPPWSPTSSSARARWAAGRWS